MVYNNTISIVKELNQKLDKLTEAITKNGGKGSGNFGHSGRPGKVGGSGTDGSIAMPSRVEMRRAGFSEADIEQYEQNKEDLAVREHSLKELKDSLERKKKAYSDYLAVGYSEADAEEMYGQTLEDTRYVIRKVEDRIKELKRSIGQYEEVLRKAAKK